MRSSRGLNFDHNQQSLFDGLDGDGGKESIRRV